jgi:hypothetical protein
MTISHKVTLLLASAFLCGCANVGPLATPSGYPEVTINTTNTKRVKELLLAHFASQGFAVLQDTEHMILVSKPMEGSGAVLYQVAMGNAYSSQPQMNISVTITPVGSTTKVYGHIAVAMQGVFGQNQGTNLDRGKAGRELQQVLDQLKARIEGS